MCYNGLLKKNVSFSIGTGNLLSRSQCHPFGGKCGNIHFAANSLDFSIFLSSFCRFIFQLFSLLLLWLVISFASFKILLFINVIRKHQNPKHFNREIK